MRKVSAYKSFDDVQVGDRVVQFLPGKLHEYYEGLGMGKEVEHDSGGHSRILVYWEKERENMFHGLCSYWDLGKVGHISKQKEVHVYASVKDVQIGDRVRQLFDADEPETIPIEGTVYAIGDGEYDSYVKIRWDRSHDELEESVLYWELVCVSKKREAK